ncbi:hypothetical protein [Ornithinimicrobium murale]|uniref:hypothetical protein n=1 Tax=Ornithinimicrobium murale TaxID=1050153 RepID=UPI000E0D961B|nr:hypothetical protein [Ornithinimicrobium murale]
MSIAGGLFNSNHKKDEIGDTKSTADGEATAAQAPAVDLTTSIPGFDDDTDEGLLVETGGEFGDVEGGDLGASPAGNESVEAVAGSAGDDFDYDPDSADGSDQVRLDPES